jgi:hypothetical protein
MDKTAVAMRGALNANCWTGIPWSLCLNAE